MNEMFLFMAVVVGMFLAACSVALIALGKMIDRCPMENDEDRERSLASPAEATKLAALVLWALYIPGVWAILQEGRFAIIIGITTMFAICLFAFTALVFSYVVLGTMKRRSKTRREAVLSTTPATATATTPSPRLEKPVLGSRPYKRQAANFLVDALVKKD
jgi:bacteriorhodopsin